MNIQIVFPFNMPVAYQKKFFLNAKYRKDYHCQLLDFRNKRVQHIWLSQNIFSL